MLQRYVLILIFSLFSFVSWNQNKLSLETDVVFNLRYREFFHHIYLGKQLQNWNLKLGLGYGVNSLIDSQQLFYSIPIDIKSSFKINDRFECSPFFSFQTAGFKVLVPHLILGTQIGYEMSFGKKQLKFVHRLTGGGNWEHYKGESKTWNLWMLNATFAIGARYEF